MNRERKLVAKRENRNAITKKMFKGVKRYIWKLTGTIRRKNSTGEILSIKKKTGSRGERGQRKHRETNCSQTRTLGKGGGRASRW